MFNKTEAKLKNSQFRSRKISSFRYFNKIFKNVYYSRSKILLSVCLVSGEYDYGDKKKNFIRNSNARMTELIYANLQQQIMNE